MGIFSRARDIIQANVSDLLDRAEDPAKTIRLVIMEMEETLVEVRASAARTIADQKEIRRTVIKLEQAQGNWADKAELATGRVGDLIALFMAGAYGPTASPAAFLGHPPAREILV